MAESDVQFDRRVDQAALEAQPSLPEQPSLPQQSPPPRRRLLRLAVMLSVPLLLAAGIAWYYLASGGSVATDNAYMRQDKVSVSALVTGDIVQVAVRENQHVNAGDLLFRLDPEPFRIAIAQADAAIAEAQVKVVGLQTELGSTGVDIRGATQDVKFYTDQYARAAALLDRGFATRAQIEEADHDLSNARQRLANAQAKATEARAALATAPIAPGVNPGVMAAQAQKRKAQLDLSRTEVRAPVAGTVTQSTSLQVGQLMMTGLPAVTIVADASAGWVEANFKETELADMHVGQPATLTFDAYPGVALKGHIASIGAGTGSEFSVLPAQNANGNWIKVTQRVPVRIAIDERSRRPLIAGLSAHVVVDTRR